MMLLGELHETTRPGEESSAEDQGPPDYGRSLRWAVLLFLAAYLFPFAVLRLPGFERWSSSRFGRMMDFGFQTAGQNADIVIFGDSTATFNLSPLQMSSALRLKVLTLPATLGSLALMDDMPLRHYLLRNSPPRLIVLCFSAWHLDYHDIPSLIPTYEGEKMIVRHGTPREIWVYASGSPGKFLAFPFHFFAANPIYLSLQHLILGQEPAQVARTMGHRSYDLPFGRLHAPCTYPDLFMPSRNMQAVEELIRRNRSRSTQVMVYLSPVADCNRAGELTGHSYLGVGAAPPRLLPAEAFHNDAFMSHLDESAVPVATSDLIDKVRTILSSRQSAAR